MSRAHDRLLDVLTRREIGKHHACPRCGARGAVDFLDFVRGQISLHCRACPMTWSVPTEAPLSHLGPGQRR